MCCSEENKTTLGTYALREEAIVWWRNVRLRIGEDGVAIVWETFKREFLRKYFPADVKNKKVIEFMELKQGNLSVAEYTAKFEALCVFSPHYNTVEAEEDKFEASELLGTSVGDSRRLSFWEPVLDRLKTRLSGWKSRFLSVGGRLVLLKSVLTSLPVYALLFQSSFREGVGESGGRWFGEHVVRRVGDGSDTLFWTDPWLDETPLCERFGRLYVLSETKSFTVAEMFTLGWGLDGAAWVWRRQLRAWEEEMLGECQTLLSNISLQAHITDRWQWQPDPDTGYSVRGAYELLTTLDSVTIDDAEHLIWHSQVPLKHSYAFLDVGRQSQLITYSSHAAVLVPFGL
ncbi:unnamed protein product [Trifolium pratense]|uniref:Uncharacterized protein n=1 Tax=Trifolium pratense TaxID=57577 RepID=A0ACB0ITX2_TRIPR|nr:unnamed protein product [Trifolium pratense]